MNDILCRQLAADYCFSTDEIKDNDNHFSVFSELDGRRRYRGDSDCYLKIAVVNGKVLFTVKEKILHWFMEQYRNTSGEWFFEADNLRVIDDRIRMDGYRIKFVHPFYIADKISSVDTKSINIRWYEQHEIAQFRSDDRFGEAFAFYEDAPDMLGVAAVQNDNIIGMAGASCDSPAMWQIGINVMPDSRQSGIGTILVSLLKNEILKRGFLPFYGTSMSHIISQKVALNSGFRPVWAELAVSRAENN